MRIPDNIELQEELGRSVFSESHVKKQKIIHKNAFDPPKGSNLLSVDRLGMGRVDEYIQIGEQAAKKRGRNFYGWAVIKPYDVRKNGRNLKASPKDDNPYHADIILPEIVLDDEVEKTTHAQELADASCWRSRDSVETTN